VGSTSVEARAVLRTSADELLMLLRSCKDDGSNVVKRLSNAGARGLGSLPDKAHQLVCALKHVVKEVHGIKTPRWLLESVVVEVFEQRGWIGDLDEVSLASIRFIESWRSCWRRIMSWEPISSLLEEGEEDLLSHMDKASMSGVGEALSSMDERSLLDECLKAPRQQSLVAAKPPHSSSLALASTREESDAVPILEPLKFPLGGFFAANHETGYEFFKYANYFPFESTVDDRFSLVNAAFLADAAYAAYFDKSVIPSKLARLPAQLRDSFQFFDDGGSAQGYVLHDDEVVIIVFRGSETAPRTPDEPLEQTLYNVYMDWIMADANMKLIADEVAPPGKVHRGFQLAVDAVMNNIAAIVEPLIGGPLTPRRRSPDQKRRVFVCGHSLGAAMSTVFSRRAAAVVNAVYTFGCPRCGDTQWADSFPLSSVFRLVHNLDIVTHAPACVRPAFPYKHVGEMMLIDSLGQVHEGSAAHEGAQAVFDTFLTALHHPRVVQPNTVAKTLDQNAVTDQQPVYYAAFLWNQSVANSNDNSTNKKKQ